MCGGTKLTVVGAERMYVCLEPPVTTHAGDCMFIMEEVVEGQKWYVAYEGRPVSKGVGEQELEKRAVSYFGLVLGGWSACMGEKPSAEQGHLCRTGARTAVASI